MFDVRKTVMRWAMTGVAAGVLAASAGAAFGQVGTQINIKRRQEAHARRETNASRQARIQRTITDTYSHRYEVIGGGGFLRFRSGATTKRNNEINWATAFNYYLNPKLALVGDAQGSFGTAKPTIANGFIQSSNPQINEYFFMGGASYRFYRKEKVALSAQGLGGIGWGIFSGGSKSIPSVDLGLWQDGTRPAFSASVSADYNFYPNLAFRFSPNWIATTFQSGPLQPASSLQSNFGFNAGVLYRFGRQ
jgi:hypothetical protein